MQDLNKLTIEDRDSLDGTNQSIAVAPVTSGATTVYFRDLEAHLLRHIHEADAVIGCVAWLTNKAVLAALSKKDPVALVVQKEDFLRPDLNSPRGWNAELRRRYGQLTCSWMRYYMPGIVGDLTYAGDPSIAPVRCVGNYNRDKNSAFPRMHHKFVVFCQIDTAVDQDAAATGAEGEFTQPTLIPYAVWTGSFNFTENGARSLENALYITDLAVVDAYVAEWARIEALSEPLDWTADWVAPEWRIGS